MKKIFAGLIMAVLTAGGISLCWFVTIGSGQGETLELIRKGIHYNIELIRSCQSNFEVSYQSGNTKKGVWFYKPGYERIDLDLAEGGAVETTVFLYNLEKGIACKYEKGIMKEYSLGLDVSSIIREINNVGAPSFLFLHLWPLGFSLDEILAKPLGAPIVEEDIAGMKCYRVDIPKYGQKEYKGVGTVNYDYLGYRIWFSWSEGFMPKKIEVYINGSLRLNIGPVSFKRIGDVWFPLKMDIAWPRNPTSKGTIEYRNIYLNSEISPEIFSPIIPSGTNVVDIGARIHYKTP